jgi:RP/EB family microtubule-associated protein
VELQNEVANLRSMTDAAIGERDFYFGKLRDVEILMQTRNLVLEKGETLSDDLKDMLASLEKILYATAEGFEVPAEDEQTAVAEGTTA